MPATRASSCPALSLSVATTVITVVDSFPGRSATLECRRPLLAQCRQRFLVVLALEGDQLERRRGVEGDVERILHELVDCELRLVHGERGTRDEAFRERHGFAVEVCGGNHPVHESDALGLG